MISSQRHVERDVVFDNHFDDSRIDVHPGLERNELPVGVDLDQNSATTLRLGLLEEDRDIGVLFQKPRVDRLVQLPVHVVDHLTRDFRIHLAP